MSDFNGLLDLFFERQLEEYEAQWSWEPEDKDDEDNRDLA